MTSYKVVINFLKNYIKQYVAPKERLSGSDFFKKSIKTIT